MYSYSFLKLDIFLTMMYERQLIKLSFLSVNQDDFDFFMCICSFHFLQRRLINSDLGTTFKSLYLFVLYIVVEVNQFILERK